jgi:uncharacterized membrane protein
MAIKTKTRIMIYLLAVIDLFCALIVWGSYRRVYRFSCD